MDLGPVRGLVQRPQHPIVYAVKNRFFIEKFHFRLGRVDIHIHRRRRQLQAQHTGWEFAHHELIPVGLLQGGDQELGFHRPVIDEKGLQIPAGPGIRGLGRKAGHTVFFPGAVHRDHASKVPAIDAVHRRPESAVARRGQNGLAVPNQGDGNLRMGQSLQLHRPRHPGALHRIGLHEFHAGRGIVKQVPDDNGGSVRAAGLVLLGHGPGLQMEADAGQGIRGLGQQINAADGGNGRQSLPAEAHGTDGIQILGAAELGGCVAQEGRAGILCGHAATVVRHPQEGHAPVPDLHGDLGGPGVHGVFQQLLGNGCRPLHHLTGGDQIGNMGG